MRFIKKRIHVYNHSIKKHQPYRVYMSLYKHKYKVSNKFIHCYIYIE